MAVQLHNQSTTFISSNSGLPIARVIAADTGSGACELWHQPLQPGDLIPMHYHLVEEIVTFNNGQIEIILDGERFEVDADRDGTSSVLIPTRLHHEIRNIGDTPTFMLAFFPALNPQIFPV